MTDLNEQSERLSWAERDSGLQTTDAFFRPDTMLSWAESLLRNPSIREVWPYLPTSASVRWFKRPGIGLAGRFIRANAPGLVAWTLRFPDGSKDARNRVLTICVPPAYMVLLRPTKFTVVHELVHHTIPYGQDIEEPHSADFCANLLVMTGLALGYEAGKRLELGYRKFGVERSADVTNVTLTA